MSGVLKSRENCVVEGQREEGAGGWMEVGKGREKGDICTVSTIKMKNKEK